MRGVAVESSAHRRLLVVDGAPADVLHHEAARRRDGVLEADVFERSAVDVRETCLGVEEHRPGERDGILAVDGAVPTHVAFVAELHVVGDRHGRALDPERRAAGIAAARLAARARSELARPEAVFVVEVHVGEEAVAEHAAFERVVAPELDALVAAQFEPARARDHAGEAHGSAAVGDDERAGGKRDVGGNRENGRKRQLRRVARARRAGGRRPVGRVVPVSGRAVPGPRVLGRAAAQRQRRQNTGGFSCNHCTKRFIKHHRTARFALLHGSFLSFPIVETIAN